MHDYIYYVFLLLLMVPIFIRSGQKSVNSHVQVPTDAFIQIVLRSPNPLVVEQKPGLFRNYWTYYHGNQGLPLSTRSAKQLAFPEQVTIIVWNLKISSPTA